MAASLTYRGAAVVAAIAVASSTAVVAPASAQGFGEHNVKPSAYPVENHPKVDEKAYKAELERILASKEKYDSWGAARPSDSAKPKTR
jgi:hypothetical protein